jgi:hypothetical protein
VGSSGAQILNTPLAKRHTSTLSYLLFRIDVLQPGRLQRVLRRYSLLRVQIQHLVQQVERRVRHEHEVFAEAPPVQLLRLESVEEGQLDDRRPNRGGRSAAHPRDHLQLHHFGVRLCGLFHRDWCVLKCVCFTWNSGFLRKSSPKMQPQLHTSIAGP